MWVCRSVIIQQCSHLSEFSELHEIHEGRQISTKSLLYSRQLIGPQKFNIFIMITQQCSIDSAVVPIYYLFTSTYSNNVLDVVQLFRIQLTCIVSTSRLRRSYKCICSKNTPSDSCIKESSHLCLGSDESLHIQVIKGAVALDWILLLSPLVTEQAYQQYIAPVVLPYCTAGHLPSYSSKQDWIM